MRKLLKVIPGFYLGKLIRKKIKVPDKDQGVIFKIATEKWELEQAYNLLHDVYVNMGYCDEHQNRIKLTHQIMVPKTVTFVGIKHDKVIITLTLYVDSVFGLPMDELYKNKLDILRKKNRSIAEVGSLVSHPDYRNSSKSLPFHINKIMYLYASNYLKIDDLVITVNPKHELIYKHILLFEKIGKRKKYNMVKGNVAVPLKLDLVKLPKNYDRAYKNFPKEKNLAVFFLKTKTECLILPDKMIPISIWNRDLFEYFFIHKTDFYSKLDQEIQIQLIDQFLNSTIEIDYELKIFLQELREQKLNLELSLIDS